MTVPLQTKERTFSQAPAKILPPAVTWYQPGTVGVNTPVVELYQEVESETAVQYLRT